VRLGLAVLAVWVMLLGGSIILLAATGDLRLACALGRALAVAAALLWLAGGFGFALGVFALIQPCGAKRWALAGAVLNGLLCLGPLIVLLLCLA
jgi:hypothetical protein